MLNSLKKWMAIVGAELIGMALAVFAAYRFGAKNQANADAASALKKEDETIHQITEDQILDAKDDAQASVEIAAIVARPIPEVPKPADIDALEAALKELGAP